MNESRQTATIGCDCGKFKALLTDFPKNTPGRLVCYCKYCQRFLHKINRADRLDEYGGTEIIPAYPADIEFLQGADSLQCHKLTQAGPFRWRTTCCNSPIANTFVELPWAGFYHSVFTTDNKDFLSTIGSIKSRVYGRYAKEGAPFPISTKTGVKDLLMVVPFLLKGKVLKKHKNSPFLQQDGLTPICSPSDI